LKYATIEIAFMASGGELEFVDNKRNDEIFPGTSGLGVTMKQ
jgi:hypothetical protein